MSAKHIVFPLLLIFNIMSIFSQEDQREREREQDSSDVEVVRSFYLLGDAGHSKTAATSPALLALDRYLSSRDTSEQSRSGRDHGGAHGSSLQTRVV